MGGQKTGGGYPWKSPKGTPKVYRFRSFNPNPGGPNGTGRLKESREKKKSKKRNKIRVQYRKNNKKRKFSEGGGSKPTQDALQSSGEVGTMGVSLKKKPREKEEMKWKVTAKGCLSARTLTKFKHGPNGCWGVLESLTEGGGPA